MYFGETPSAMNALSVGVNPRLRKSARNPSSEMRMVVAAKFDVPFDLMALSFGIPTPFFLDILKAPNKSRPKSDTIAPDMKRICSSLGPVGFKS